MAPCWSQTPLSLLLVWVVIGVVNSVGVWQFPHSELIRIININKATQSYTFSIPTAPTEVLCQIVSNNICCKKQLLKNLVCEYSLRLQEGSAQGSLRAPCGLGVGIAGTLKTHLTCGKILGGKLWAPRKQNTQLSPLNVLERGINSLNLDILRVENCWLVVEELYMCIFQYVIKTLVHLDTFIIKVKINLFRCPEGNISPR